MGLSPDGKDEQVNLEQTGTVAQARAVLDERARNHAADTGRARGHEDAQAFGREFHAAA